jgi:hypothetical protein
LTAPAIAYSSYSGARLPWIRHYVLDIFGRSPDLFISYFDCARRMDYLWWRNYFDCLATTELSDPLPFATLDNQGGTITSLPLVFSIIQWNYFFQLS